MSDLPPAGATPGEPSEEEVRQYLAQMRSAPVEQVVAEVLQGLLNAAQVKLGRRDARLLLDAAADVAGRAGPHLSDDLRRQLDDALTQLRMGQVQAEEEVAGSGHDEPNDLVPTDPTSGSSGTGPDPGAAPATSPGSTGGPGGPSGPPGTGAPPPAGGGPGGSPLDKLWIPGR